MLKRLLIFLVVTLLKLTMACGPSEALAEPEAQGLERLRPSTLWLYGSGEHLEAEKISDKLADVIKRVGPNMRASSDYHDYQDIKLNESIEAWQLMHKRVMEFAQNQVQFYAPKIDTFLEEANVTSKCRESVSSSMESIKKLNSRAIQMVSSTGNFPPVGLFDGQFSDIGSYRGCVDARLTVNQRVANQYLSYCLLSFRPTVPSRYPYHRIFEREDKRLVNLWTKSENNHTNSNSADGESEDIFFDFANFAQYFHYVHLQTGVCVPHDCSHYDLQQVAALIASRLYLMAGPVRCFTRANVARNSSYSYSQVDDDMVQVDEIDNRPSLVLIGKPMDLKQIVALVLIGSFYSLVLLSTLWHFFESFILNTTTTGGVHNEMASHHQVVPDSKTIQINIEQNSHKKKVNHQVVRPIEYSGIKRVAFYYLSMITNGEEFIDTSMKRNEIKCLHGFRVATMCWIIIVHTLQYNQWSGFTRIFENVRGLQNPIAHPIYNANYVVDNFFLMSGLLASYTTWYSNKGTSINFSFIASLIGRYLRLTPQVFLVSLMYIALPLAAHGPFWFDMTHYAAKYCEKNWWVNLLHLQAFYREDEICNLVGWWISVDMFYYIIGLVLLWMILNKKQSEALLCTIALVFGCICITAYMHFYGKYPPNNLGVVPQIAEVWTEYVVNFFWSPYPHAFPFYLGLWLGYVMANNKWRQQVRRWKRVGWILSISSMILVNISSYIWMSGYASLNQNQIFSTSYNVICTLVWSLGFGWIIVALHYGCAPRLNRLLSIKLFVMMSKASFIVYLSHMLIIRSYFGLQNTLLEVSILQFLYIMIGNIALSSLFGVFLCISYEGPWMKFQRFVVQKVRPNNRQLPIAGSSYIRDLEDHDSNNKMESNNGT